MTTASGAVQLARTQVKDAGEVLARAFHEDPFVMWLVPDEVRRAQAMAWGMAFWARYCLRFREVYATAGKVDGAAIWVPPGKFPMSLLRLMLSGMILTPLKLGPAGFRRFMSAANHMEHLHKRDVPPQHWYLWILGVDPSRQGQGLGGALIQPVVERADAEGLPCYLESANPRNLPFYQRHGFEVVVEGELPNSGPHFWTMKREPVR